MLACLVTLALSWPLPTTCNKKRIQERLQVLKGYLRIERVSATLTGLLCWPVMSILMSALVTVILSWGRDMVAKKCQKVTTSRDN